MDSLKLTILGSATSQGVPVIGCDCPACRSTDPRDDRTRNSALFSRGDSHVVIDTGPDFRRQMLRTGIKEVAGVLYTHEHNDHVAGMDDLRPFCFRQKMDIPLYALPRVVKEIKSRFAYAFGENRYPGVPTLKFHEIEAGDHVPLGDFIFEAIPVMHGRLPILGFRCEDVAYLTDVKTLDPVAKGRLRNLRVLVITCLQREPHIAHLTLDECLALIEELQPERAILTHLSHLIGPHAQLQAVLPRGVEVGYDGMIL
ncbi:MAG: MBL fold metallo-hydrolase [Bacteroidota bacterium]